jgi:acyl carrier protein
MKREKAIKMVLDVLNEQFRRTDCKEETRLRTDWGSNSIVEMEFMLGIEYKTGMELFDSIKTVHVETPKQIIDLIMEKDNEL